MAEKKNDTLVERVQESYRKLSLASSSINTASDKLGVSVSGLDAALKKLSLGISSWIDFSSWTSPDGFHFSNEEIGYTKINGKWGLAIRTRSGNEGQDIDDIEEWPFNEAPRLMRVHAIARVPDLLDKLLKDATDITEKITRQTQAVDMLTSAMTAAARQPAPAGEDETKCKR